MPAKATAKPHSLQSPGRRATLRAALLGVGAGMLAHRAIAAAFELRVIIGDSSETTRQILEVMARRLPGHQAGADVGALTRRPGPGVYVAVGPAALQAALEAQLGGPLLSLFASNETYTRVIATLPRRLPGSISAIYAEASPHSQMLLIRALYARRVSVGVLLTAGTAHQEAALRRAALSANLDLDLQFVETGENVVRALMRVKSAAALLAIPDRSLYTAENLRNILESTYRRGQGVIGFSPSLVNAGTLAAAYSSIYDTVAQVGEVAAEMAAGRVPEPQHPLYWRVAINDNVARSLNIVVDSAARAIGNFPP